MKGDRAKEKKKSTLLLYPFVDVVIALLNCILLVFTYLNIIYVFVFFFFIYKRIFCCCLFYRFDAIIEPERLVIS